MTDEQKLLLALQAREEDALETAIKIYTPYLSAVLYRTAGDHLSKEDAEEVVADVFLTLWQNAERIDLRKGTMRGYLAAAARNLTIRRLRSEKNVCSLDELDGKNIAGSVYPPKNRFLWDAVAELGEEDLELFVRYYRYGESLREISHAMKLNLSTVKTRLSRGKKKLKQILNAEESI